MAFTQAEIDGATFYRDLHNNPGGGNSEDYTEICTIATAPDNQTEYVWWKSGDDETASGFEKHKIGLVHPRNTRVIYDVVTLTTAFKINNLIFDDIYRVHGFGVIPLRPTANAMTVAPGYTKVVEPSSGTNNPIRNFGGPGQTEATIPSLETIATSAQTYFELPLEMYFYCLQVTVRQTKTNGVPVLIYAVIDNTPKHCFEVKNAGAEITYLDLNVLGRLKKVSFHSEGGIST